MEKSCVLIADYLFSQESVGFVIMSLRHRLSRCWFFSACRKNWGWEPAVPHRSWASVGINTRSSPVLICTAWSWAVNRKGQQGSTQWKEHLAKPCDFPLKLELLLNHQLEVWHLYQEKKENWNTHRETSAFWLAADNAVRADFCMNLSDCP